MNAWRRRQTRRQQMTQKIFFWQVVHMKTSQFAFSAKVFPYHGNPLEGRFRTQSWPLDHRKIDSMDLDALPMGSFISLYHL